jgi:hypothetical protein
VKHRDVTDAHLEELGRFADGVARSFI